MDDYDGFVGIMAEAITALCAELSDEFQVDGPHFYWSYGEAKVRYTRVIDGQHQCRTATLTIFADGTTTCERCGVFCHADLADPTSINKTLEFCIAS